MLDYLQQTIGLQGIRNIYFLLCMHSNISIAIRIGSSKTSGGRQITASMLRNIEEIKQLIKRDEGYRFLTAFWEKSKRELLEAVFYR